MTLIELAKKQNKSILITGKEASGKSTLARQLAKSDEPFVEISSQHLNWHFNTWIKEGLKTVIVEGKLNNKLINKIKQLTLNKTILVERKGHNPVKYKTPNFIICSQSRPIAIKPNDRRFLIVKLG